MKQICLKCPLCVFYLEVFDESSTNPTCHLHSLGVLLLWVAEDDVREVGPRDQTFNMISQMNQHSITHED